MSIEHDQAVAALGNVHMVITELQAMIKRQAAHIAEQQTEIDRLNEELRHKLCERCCKPFQEKQ